MGGPDINSKTCYLLFIQKQEFIDLALLVLKSKWVWFGSTWGGTGSGAWWLELAGKLFCDAVNVVITAEPWWHYFIFFEENSVAATMEP